MIHCIDHNEAQNERFKFKHEGAIYHGTIEYDGDCVDGEMVACNSFTIKDSNGTDAPEWMLTDDYLAYDVNEIISSLQHTEYVGGRYNPFEPADRRAWLERYPTAKEVA